MPAGEWREAEFEDGGHGQSLVKTRDRRRSGGTVLVCQRFMDRTGRHAKQRFSPEGLFLRLGFSNGRINALVCMFNSFALAGPFCERMKLPRLGRSAAGAAAASKI